MLQVSTYVYHERNEFDTSIIYRRRVGDRERDCKGELHAPPASLQLNISFQVLLEHNAKVYIAARNRSQAETAIAELKASTGKEALFLELDLANLAAVRKAAEDFLSKERELHILFNNACVPSLLFPVLPS